MQNIAQIGHTNTHTHKGQCNRWKVVCLGIVWYLSLGLTHLYYGKGHLVVDLLRRAQISTSKWWFAYDMCRVM